MNGTCDWALQSTSFSVGNGSEREGRPRRRPNEPKTAAVLEKSTATFVSIARRCPSGWPFLLLLPVACCNLLQLSSGPPRTYLPAKKVQPDAGLYDRHYHPARPLHLIPLLFQYLPANIVHWFRLNFHDFFLTTGHRRGNVVTWFVSWRPVQPVRRVGHWRPEVNFWRFIFTATVGRLDVHWFYWIKSSVGRRWIFFPLVMDACRKNREKLAAGYFEFFCCVYRNVALDCCVSITPITFRWKCNKNACKAAPATVEIASNLLL